MNEHKPEPWIESLMGLKCINGAMYFGSVEDDTCNCKTRCQNEQTFQHATEEMVGFIRTLLANQNTAKYHEGYKQGRFDQKMEGNTANAERIRGLERCGPPTFIDDEDDKLAWNEALEAAARLIEEPLTGKE